MDLNTFFLLSRHWLICNENIYPFDKLDVGLIVNFLLEVGMSIGGYPPHLARTGTGTGTGGS